MTTVTAAAAAGFGLVLATLCRTRQQLGGISTILILSQSAIGGSMFPRFIMSEGLRSIGRFTTFNANALDGYEKVFWREAPLVSLWPQVLVLAILAVVFFSVARVLARRWVTV
jgi:ABC-2 type transport system permease protein